MTSWLFVQTFMHNPSLKSSLKKAICLLKSQFALKAARLSTNLSQSLLLAMKGVCLSVHLWDLWWQMCDHSGHWWVPYWHWLVPMPPRWCPHPTHAHDNAPMVLRGERQHCRPGKIIFQLPGDANGWWLLNWDIAGVIRTPSQPFTALNNSASDIDSKKRSY